MSPPNLPKREEYLRRKRKRKIIRFAIIFSLLLLLIGVLSFVSRRPSLRISEVELSGGILVTEEDIQKETTEFLRGSFFWLFPKDNFIIYPKKKLALDLKEKFKRIDNININRRGLNTLKVEITERKPVAIWCNSVPENEDLPGIEVMEDGTIIEKCYFLDVNGTVFSSAPNFSGDAYFKYYGLIGEVDPVGKQYMSTSMEFREISDFVVLVKKLRISPLYIVAGDNGEFYMAVSGGWKIYFDMREPLSRILLNLEALFRTPEFSKTGIEKLHLDYVDMRFGNKLFYKLKN